MDKTVHKLMVQTAEQMAKGGRNVFFTGAGISTESGIPDYRSQGGIWDRFRPVYFDEFMSSRESRIEYWERNMAFHGDLAKAEPNAAHKAIFKLYEMGLVEAVITQNIDGLHQASGFPEDKIIELHGSTRRVRCMTCRRISPLEAAYKRIRKGDPAPECDCGGYLKPDTISFGQAMPVEEVEKATALSRQSNCFMVVGSTLLVQPAALMPVYAHRNQAFLCIVNLSDTPCDDMSDVLIRHSAGETLEEIFKAVKSMVQ